MKQRTGWCAFSAVATGMAVATTASAGTVFDEQVDGDLSNDRFNPTEISVTAGSNSFAGETVAGDRDFLTFSIAPGFQLDAIFLDFYDSQSEQSFIAIETGTQLDTDPDGGDPSGLLGYVHFGTGPGNVGTDILDDMGVGAGAVGFLPPLGASDYTVWIQETGPSPAAYTFRLEISAVPAPGGLLMIAAAFVTGRRRRRWC